MSGFAFRPGVSACIVGGRVILLDLDADRYFGLTDPLDRSLRQTMAVEALSAGDRENLETLFQRGLLVRADGESLPRVCPSPARLASSLFDATDLSGRRFGQLRAATSILRARLMLRVSGLARSITHLRHSRHGAFREDASALRAIAGDFAGAVTWVSALDQCLVQSLAVACQLAGARLTHQFVMGVSVRPFRAHAWVQCGDVVVNDRVDMVRRFTPILIV